MILRDHMATERRLSTSGEADAQLLRYAGRRILPGQPALLAYWVNRMSAAPVVTPIRPGGVRPGAGRRSSDEMEET